MSIVVTKKLVCDFPDCGAVKGDCVWWESDPGDEGPWRHTSDDRDWCPRHTEKEIAEVYRDRRVPTRCFCMECEPTDRRGFRRMHVCPRCGSKRCPGAMNHEYVKDGCGKDGSEA